MTTTYTANVALAKPGNNDAGWGATLNTDLDYLAAMKTIGALAVKEAELPSTTRNIRVASGSFRKADGTVVDYAGTSSFATTASRTNLLWLTDSGVLTEGTAWPAADIVRLATVVTGATTITSVADARLAFTSFGTASSGAPANATYIVQTANSTLSAEQVLGALATGILKNTTTTGVLSIAVAGTDYLAPSGSGASLTALNATQLTTGTVPTARLGTGTANSSSYLRGDQTWATLAGGGDASTNTATSVDSEVVLFSSTTGKLLKRATTTGIAKLASGVLSAAAAGTDYVAPTGSGSGLTSLNASNLASGTVATARLGTGTADTTTFLRGDGTWTAPTAGITVQDEGTPLTTAGTTLNFVGSGVVASGTGATKTITITAGGLTTAGWTMDEGANIVLGATTGTKIGTGATQKLGFFGATPAVQPSGSSEIIQGLVNLGLRAATGNPDLTINDGALTCGQVTIQNGWNVILGTSTGTKIGTATTQKLSFWNATPVTQPASANQAALTDSSGGTPSTTIAAISDTATKNAVASLALLLNQLRSDLVSAGIIKGSA